MLNAAILYRENSENCKYIRLILLEKIHKLEILNINFVV